MACNRFYRALLQAKLRYAINIITKITVPHEDDVQECKSFCISLHDSSQDSTVQDSKIAQTTALCTLLLTGILSDAIMVST